MRLAFMSQCARETPKSKLGLGFSVVIPWVLPPLSNSWIITIIWLYMALNRTPNIDCYWVETVPKSYHNLVLGVPSIGYHPSSCSTMSALGLKSLDPKAVKPKTPRSLNPNPLNPKSLNP